MINLPEWQARLRSRVYQRFFNSNWAIPTANAIGAGANELQAAFVALLSAWSIDPVTSDPTSPSYGVGRGVQLDRIGALVGRARLGAVDDIYRVYLRAQFLINRSNGTGDALIKIVGLLVPAGTSIYLKAYPPASVLIQPLGPVGLLSPYDIAANFLSHAVMGGVSLSFVYTYVAAANTFTFGSVNAAGFAAGPPVTNAGVVVSQDFGSVNDPGYAAGPPVSNIVGGAFAGVAAA